MLLGPHHHVRGLAGGPHEAGQRGGVAETVHVVGDFREDAEPVRQIALPEFDLALKADGIGEVAVRLNPPPADERPSAGLDVPLDAGEQHRIDLLDLLVAPGLAGGEDEIGPLVEQVAHGAARGEGFIQSGLPGPQPDGIEMGVGDDVYRDACRHFISPVKHNSTQIRHLGEF